MQKENMLYQTFLQILKEEMIPAMGCTEPIAIALAAAKAREVLGEMPDSVVTSVSNNLVKNAKSVVVPNTEGLKGISAAVAAGIVAGKAEKELEVIAEVQKGEIAKIRKFLDTVPIRVEQLDNDITFDLYVEVKKGKNSALVHIQEYHTNIVEVKKNDEIIFVKDEYKEKMEHDGVHQKEKCDENANAEKTKAVKEADRDLLTLEDIYEFANTVDLEDVRNVISKQIDYNTRIAEEGMRGDYGANIGSTILKTYGTSIENRAKAYAAAGSDARMSGCEMPVVINAGSGNQGITVSIPVIVYAKEMHTTEEILYRALVLSNLTSVHVKTGIGRLSAYCGAVSAGCAAGCGIAYLYGGNYEVIAHTLVNALAICSGMICDGAKASCAAKIASSVEAGILGYHMFCNGQEFRDGDGIVTKGVENTIQNVSRLGKEGMKETDKEIVRIMLRK